jgi:hypothetical protein
MIEEILKKEENSFGKHKMIWTKEKAHTAST